MTSFLGGTGDTMMNMTDMTFHLVTLRHFWERQINPERGN